MLPVMLGTVTGPVRARMLWRVGTSSAMTPFTCAPWTCWNMACMTWPLKGKSAVAFTDCHRSVGWYPPNTSWVPGGMGTGTGVVGSMLSTDCVLLMVYVPPWAVSSPTDNTSPWSRISALFSPAIR